MTNQNCKFNLVIATVVRSTISQNVHSENCIWYQIFHTIVFIIFITLVGSAHVCTYLTSVKCYVRFWFWFYSNLLLSNGESLVWNLNAVIGVIGQWCVVCLRTTGTFAFPLTESLLLHHCVWCMHCKVYVLYVVISKHIDYRHIA